MAGIALLWNQRNKSNKLPFQIWILLTCWEMICADLFSAIKEQMG